MSTLLCVYVMISTLLYVYASCDKPTVMCLCYDELLYVNVMISTLLHVYVILFLVHLVKIQAGQIDLLEYFQRYFRNNISELFINL